MSNFNVTTVRRDVRPSVTLRGSNFLRCLKRLKQVLSLLFSSAVTSKYMYVCMYDICMYVYCTYYALIYRANEMEKASFARIIGAERRAAYHIQVGCV